MKAKKEPTLINCVEDIYKHYLCGSGKKFYVSNLVSPEILICFIEMMADDIEITYFDYRELDELSIMDLKRNGRVKYKLNKKYIIYKQTYYYYSKNKRKYFTTMVKDYIKINCNYTNYIRNYRFMQSKIFYASYENTTDLINADNDLNISKQSVYLYERESYSCFLAKKEQELLEKIKKLDIKASGYYHYDEEYIKINKEVYVRLSLIDAHTRIIINDILIQKNEFDKEYVKKFLTESLNVLPLDTIITDGHKSYPEIIDELGAKHQLYVFHIMSNLMNPLNKRLNTLNRNIESKENSINDINDKISKLKEEYSYKQGRPPKSDKNACKNLQNRKKLKKEKSELKEKLDKYKKEYKELINYKERIKVIFNRKTLKAAKNKFNKLWDKKEELPQIIYDFLNNLSKKIKQALEFTEDPSIPKTNNLVELFYKVTFPGKIKRIYRTVEGAINRIRMNNIRWMERNVIKRHEEKIMANQ